MGRKAGQLHGEAAVGVQRERGALEDELVLSADEVEINQRQAALDHARNRDILADRELVALVRRRVGDEQDLAAGLEDAFDRVGSPDVLADRHADAHALKDDRARRGARRKHPLLVENAVVRQVDLEPHRFDPAMREERHRVVQLALLDPRQADQHRRARRPPSPAPAPRRPRGRPPGTRASARDPPADSRKGRVPAPARGRRRRRRPRRALFSAGRGCPRCRRRSRGFARAR